MRSYAAANKHVYLDYYSAMIDSTGMLKTELSDDDLHPNAEATRRWRRLRRPRSRRHSGSVRGYVSCGSAGSERRPGEGRWIKGGRSALGSLNQRGQIRLREERRRSRTTTTTG